jgi:hypothetical protein
MNLDKFWDFCINKSHVLVVTVFQGAILIAHWKYGKDLSVGVQSTVNWFYLFMAGHFGASQVWPDKTAPTVDVNVNNQNTNTATATVVPAPVVADPSKG